MSGLRPVFRLHPILPGQRRTACARPPPFLVGTPLGGASESVCHGAYCQLARVAVLPEVTHRHVCPAFRVPGMCPDRRPLGLQPGTQPPEPHQPGLHPFPFHQCVSLCAVQSLHFASACSAASLVENAQLGPVSRPTPPGSESPATFLPAPALGAPPSFLSRLSPLPFLSLCPGWFQWSVSQDSSSCSAPHCPLSPALLVALESVTHGHLTRVLAPRLLHPTTPRPPPGLGRHGRATAAQTHTRDARMSGCGAAGVFRLSSGRAVRTTKINCCLDVFLPRCSSCPHVAGSSWPAAFPR